MSQEELAERSDLHRTYLSDVERGSRNPSFLTLLAIARGLGLTVSEMTRDINTGGTGKGPLGKHHLAPDPVAKTNKNTWMARSYLSRE